MSYVIDRLKEPGTMRSLAVVVFGLLGVTPDDATLNGVLWLVTIGLGLVSAFMPEKKVVDAASVVEVTKTATETAVAANGAVQEARSILGMLAGKLR